MHINYEQEIAKYTIKRYVRNYAMYLDHRYEWKYFYHSAKCFRNAEMLQNDSYGLCPIVSTL